MNQKKRAQLFLAVLFTAWVVHPGSVYCEELRPANIFTDNMVLQRQKPFVIWGWANPTQDVSVSLKNQTVTATANADGKWMTQFSPIEVGEPFEIRIVSESQSVTLKNVVAGEVWICSGQSNMEWTVQGSANPEQEKANAKFPQIRHVKLNHVTSPGKNDDAPNTGWQICAPETVGQFTAVGYYFGRELHQNLDVPIGLINTSWGGTIIEAWISGESLKSHRDFADVVRGIESSAGDESKQIQQAEQLKAWNARFKTAWDDPSEQWKDPDADDAAWKEIQVPGQWEGQGYPGLDGVAWYRRKFSVPANWIGKAPILSIAKIDDEDQTFVNGQKVGSVNGWNSPRKYNLPATLLKQGENSIAIRVGDGNGGGGIHGGADEVWISVEGEPPIPLHGTWKFQPTEKTIAIGPKPQVALNGPNHPTVLHNAMVHPIVPYTIRGTIWYQGESNAGRAYQYRSLMPLLVKDWRAKWNQDFSFYWVQLANFMAPAEEPKESAWAELRESQSMALTVPKTGQAVIIDIGEARDIHPKNKQDVGRRLALIALAKDYGKSNEYSGPVYQSIAIEGNQARLTFTHADGMHAKGETLNRFQIAGADKRFYWADARIDGDQVIVSSPEVAQPVAVRYAWADNPSGCNLYNSAGLPASPFRTDSWKGITQN